MHRRSAGSESIEHVCGCTEDTATDCRKFRTQSENFERENGEGEGECECGGMAELDAGAFDRRNAHRCHAETIARRTQRGQCAIGQGTCPPPEPELRAKCVGVRKAEKLPDRPTEFPPERVHGADADGADEEFVVRRANGDGGGRNGWGG